MYPYQIDDLRQAIEALRQHVPGLIVVVSDTGQIETTLSGKFPTVEYVIEFGGQRRFASNHPRPVVVAPGEIAQALRHVLSHLTDPQIQSLIDDIEGCPVS